VGVDIIRSLALTQVVFSENEEVERILPANSILDHGYQVANLAKRLAKHSGVPLLDGNTAFTAGLLHDVGKLILLNAFPDRYEKVLELSKSDSRNLDELEMEEFDATHQGVGAYLFVLWGLPANVTDAVVSHHSFSICSRSENVASKLVFAANWILGGKTPDALNALLDSVESTEAGQLFAKQITEWQQFNESNTTEE
jgi:putative nucleotidyltransferase with HDIG domain